MGTAQNNLPPASLSQRITLRPVIGAGGEAAVGGGVIAEYSNEILRQGPTVELILQLGGFHSIGSRNSLYRRDYKFKSFLSRVGLKLGTGSKGTMYGKIGVGLSYHRGTETDEYLKESQGGNQLWLPANRRYREIVFNSSLEVGVRLKTLWEISVASTLIFGVGEGNGLLLIGPGVSRRF